MKQYWDNDDLGCSPLPVTVSILHFLVGTPYYFLPRTATEGEEHLK